jgi:non-specific serine/threonine protein kinase
MVTELLAAVAAWQTGPPLPVPRSEVAAAAVKGEIVVAGGFLAGGASSGRVDAYSPERRRWRRLPNLPIAVNHAMAASYRGRLYVVGGYDGRGRVLRRFYVLAGRRWRQLAPLPVGRAAAGAAVVRDWLYVVGGVAPNRSLARVAYRYSFRRRLWSRMPAPTPREHLAVAADRSRIYAIGGRTGGLDQNLAVVEVFTPPSLSWVPTPPVPEPRGGTGAAFAGGRIVSVGGEAPTGTLRAVYAFSLSAARWTRLADLPTPRHGLAVVGIGSTVYAIAGGDEPGLHVSGRNESLDLRG